MSIDTGVAADEVTRVSRQLAGVFKTDTGLPDFQDVAKGLERLLEKVTRHCGIIEGFKFEDLTDHPRKIQVLQRIVGIVDFDSVHEHPSSVSFRKQPIIKEYVDKALGN